MEPKPSRLPRRITIQPSSSPLSSRMLRRDGVSGSSDAYRTRDSALRYDSDLQTSNSVRSSSRDWLYRERESVEPSWKTPSSTYSHCSGSYDRPVSGSFLGNRNRVSTASSSSQPSWYDPLERSQSTYTGLRSRQQDWDSKRPKLSYPGCTPLSSGRSTTSSTYTPTTDPSSGYGRFTRTSSSMLHTELSRERDRERRADTAIPNLSDYGHRSSDLAQSYLNDRVSSYAQGARPKDSSLSTVQLNSSISRQLPSQSSLLTRDSSRTSRTSNSRDLRSQQRETSSDVPHTTSRREASARSTSGTGSSTQRSTSDQTPDGDGRRTTRHLLSRLASSMSSTFFSRRSSQDSLSGRPQDAEEAHSSSPEPSAASSSARDAPESRPSEPSQGLQFLRRRRLGISSDSENDNYRSEDAQSRTSGSLRPSEPSQGLQFLRSRRLGISSDSDNDSSRSEDTESRTSGSMRPSVAAQGFSFLRRRRLGNSSDCDGESYRSEDSETRATSSSSSPSWLPSSIRNRCTPLFSRRRREGRDETARESSADTNRRHNPFRRASQEDTSLDDVHINPEGAAAAANVSSLSLDSSSGSSAAATIAETLFGRRNSGITGMLPSSLLQFSMPAALGSSLSDNVMITVDIIPSGRASDAQEGEKAPKPSRDPEKLQKIKESLLLEDSEEEDCDLCRICQTGVSSPSNPFIEPCKCAGSLQYVHQDCMKKWLHAKINSGSNLETITTCELCKEKLDLNLEDFDIQELYQEHAHERAEYEFISSGLYLVVLLHLCEQRFSDILGAANEANTRVRFINLARTLQAHMEDLDTSDDSDDEQV